MKIHYLYILAIICLSGSCTNHETKVPHHGKKMLNKQIVLDSIIVRADTTSGRGNFYLTDSVINFADSYYMSIFQFCASDGRLLSQYFERGQGPDEIPSFMYAYPLANTDKKNFMVDNSIHLYTYTDENYNLKHLGGINFGWDKVVRNDYNSPSTYHVMEMTDFGISFTYLNDSTWLIPVGPVNRAFDVIDARRYKKGHIFAELNLHTMSIDKLFGCFPEIYKEKPSPYFEFFQYALNKDTLYVNHAVDSLIYVYKYPDTLLYTMGYESKGVNRNYTIGYDVDISNFKEDIKRVGANTGLAYIKETNQLVRTSLKNFETGIVYFQLYSDTNLIFEATMPRYFKFLGYCDGIYYGVRMIPLENDDEMNFVFYRIKIM